MSGAESESGESNVSVTMSSVEAAASAMLTDSENANNENRVIEMASGNPATEETEPATAQTSETADESDIQPKAEHSPPLEPKQSSSEEPSKSQDRDQYAEHVTYNETGEAIYTDPATKFQYRWSTDKNEWIPTAGGASEGPKADTAPAPENPFENEHYRWCHETNKWLPKETPTETEHYRWDATTGKWIPKQPVAATPSETTPESDDRQYGYEDGVHTYKDKDGAVYFWDEERKAWFPKIDDDFMAIYQLNYGFIDNTSGTAKPAESERSGPAAAATRSVESDEQSKEKEPEEEGTGGQGKGKKRKAPPEPPKWFDLAPEQNTKVYVSNLPTDISEEEFGAVMSKCGMVMKDPKANKLKLKLYRDADGKPKGDGLCHYIKVESVELALSILDNYDVRGHKIKVQRAEFQMRGEYNPNLKPKMRKKEKERLKKMQESLFDWRPEKMRGERSKHERIVIIKNLFEPALFDREVHLLLEYQNDLREECGKCGSVRRVLLYDRHPEGVAQVTMGDPEEADLVVQLMNGRFFGQRKLSAAIWDGRTKYRIAETDADIDKRRGNWEEFLEADEQDKSTPKESLSIDSEKSDSRETRKEQKVDSKDDDKRMSKVQREEPEMEAGETTPEMKSEHEPPGRIDEEDQRSLPEEKGKEEVKGGIEAEQRNGSSSSDDDVDE